MAHLCPLGIPLGAPINRVARGQHVSDAEEPFPR
jgi:hypothetical protein